MKREQSTSAFILNEFILIAAIMINSRGIKRDQLFLTQCRRAD